MQSSHKPSLPITFRQPFKAFYLAYRLLLLPPLILAWIPRYILPSTRPRSGWTLKQCIVIRVVRWIMPMNAMTGIHPLRTDKTREVPQHELKETSFVWLEPVDKTLIRGIAEDEKVLPVRIPGYIWPKETPLPRDGTSLVGLWIHGGGYMMGNGTESFAENEIARQIYQNTKIKNILSVDYRLTSEACHPGQLLDALAAYNHLVNVAGIHPSRIVVFGACAGGHLVPLLVRYLYEEKVLPLPAAMMLFSPWIDMVIDHEIDYKEHKLRANTDIDLLSTSFNANLLFLGHHPLSLLHEPAFSANRAPPGSFTSYPRTFISVGDAEMYLTECTELYERMHGDGVDVTLDVQKDAVHDFLGIKDAPTDEARRNVVKAVAAWLEDI